MEPDIKPSVSLQACSIVILTGLECHKISYRNNREIGYIDNLCDSKKELLLLGNNAFIKRKISENRLIIICEHHRIWLLRKYEFYQYKCADPFKRHKKFECEKLLSDMYTVYVESNLARPLAGSATVEVGPRDTVRKVVYDFLFFIEKDGVPGLAVFDDQYNKLDWDATMESQGIKEGSTLYLLPDKSSSAKPVPIVVIGIAAIIIAAILFMTTSILFSTTGGDIPFDYGIVIDAGSTHTEVFLYQWFGSKYLGTGEVNQRDFCTIEMGIAEGYDPAELVACVNNVTNAIPSDVTSPVNLYLGATAGMRILNLSNPLEASLILTAIKYALKGTSAQEKFINIIQGQDEGIFSWITANFLSKTLMKDVNATYGALDLGGASTQIALVLNSKAKIDSSDVETLKLYGQEYHVLAKSFLCFGLSQAADRSEAIIFMSNTNSTIVDPCLPEGYSHTLRTKKFFEGPCIQNHNLTSWLELNGNVKDLLIIGSSDYKKCRDNVKKVINPNACKEMNFTYCLEVVNIALENKRYMAFSSFYYVVNYLSSNGSLQEFVRATEHYCSLTYDQIKMKTKDEELLAHLVRYCFGAVYIVELLISVYGFNSSTWRNIIFQQNINGADVGWALGFMINATNAIPEELPKPPVIGLSAFVPLAVISALMILIAGLLLQRHLKICHKRQKDSLLDSIGEI